VVVPLRDGDQAAGLLLRRAGVVLVHHRAPFVNDKTLRWLCSRVIKQEALALRISFKLRHLGSSI
jgi:hypothetical protein